MAERSNVWVRHSLLVSACSSDTAGALGGAPSSAYYSTPSKIGSSSGSSSRPPVGAVSVGSRSGAGGTNGYGSSSNSGAAGLSVIGGPSGYLGNKLAAVSVSKTPSKDLADDYTDTTSITANSSMASSAFGAGGNIATGLPSEQWGWVKAVRIDGQSSSSAEEEAAQEDGGLTIVVTDPESEFDGRTVRIPNRILEGRNTGGGGGGSNSSSIVGDGIVMANSWANFASSAPAPATRSNNANANAGSNLHLSGGALEIPPEDLINLTHLHEPAVVYCLRYRYTLDEIYTATGPILLALNPFKDCRRSLYSLDLMRKYWERGEGITSAGTVTATSKSKSTVKAHSEDDRLPPHVYAVADNAYRAMMRTLDDLRGLSTTSSDAKTPPTATTPSTATKSARNLITESANQSILVSGESGAGKTVTAKFLMQYLAALSKRSAARIQKAEEANKPIFAVASPRAAGGAGGAVAPSAASNTATFDSRPSHFGTAVDAATAATYQQSHPSLSSPTSHGHVRSSSIEQQVLESNPILESFGNARTIRNDNSSRFGKFIEINFCDSGTLIGASIETYLLEKVRLISHADGERNYHIFYELLAGASGPDQKKLMIDYASPEDFVMTRSASGTYHRRDGVHDESTFQELKTAMNTMGFDGEEQLDIFEIVSALLHLSNLTFVERGHDECLLEESTHSLEAALELCGVTLDGLEAALCSVVIEAGGERLVKTLGMAQCSKALEALIKATYGALFEYLVRRVNGCIASGVEAEDHLGSPSTPASPNFQPPSMSETAAFIGVLDIFGFESFDTNSFEQLCINYCNESLQQQFNKFVFKLEQAEYEREGISWKFIDFPDNQDILDLIDKRHTGILSVLDEQCIQAFNNDQSFASSLYDKHCGRGGASASFAANNGQKARGMFNVHHYAGPVEYNTNAFLEKNKDETPKEINELLASSENHFLQHLGEIILSRPVATNNRTPSKFGVHRHKQSSLIRVSVGKQFSSQLKQLRTRIDATSPHYIRCLKPNNDLRPDHFDCAVIADQLRYAGILEAIRVSRVGYPQRYLHERFLSRYRILALKELKSKEASKNPAVECKAVVDAIAKKIWARQHNISIGEEENPFYMPHTRNKKKPVRQSSAPPPRTPSRYTRTPSRCHTPSTFRSATPPPSARAKDVDRFKANATPPPWASHKLRPATPVSHRHTTIPATPTPTPAATSTESPMLKPPASAAKPKLPKSAQKPKAAAPPAAKEITVPDKIDLVEIGVQLGKTKVFLRQHAFDALEGMRNRLKTIAATMINSAARMYLSRIAYLPVRDAYREEQDGEGAFWMSAERDHGEHYYSEHTPLALVEKFNNQVRAQPKKKKKKVRAFKWLIVDGHWRRNVNYEEQLAAFLSSSPRENSNVQV